ncbi:MAG: large ribosomal subunit protein bL35 [Candidatus Aminicenantales bacterium]
MLHRKTNKSHILTKKAANRKRNLGKVAILNKTNRRAVKEMMPYEF